jgi:hypothetical protein
MKLCFVAHLNDLSGANRSLMDLSIAMKEAGHSVTVVIPRRGELENELIKNKIDYKVIYSGTWGAVKEKKFKRIYKKICNLIAEFRLYRFVTIQNYDIVHFNSITYGVGSNLMMKYKKPYVWHLRENFEELNITFYDKSKTFSTVNSADKIITISNSSYQFYSKIFDKNKIKLIYNGLKYNDNFVVNRSFGTSDVIEVLIVGAIYKGKGQLEAVKALEYVYANHCSNIRLNIVGQIIDKDYLNEIKSYISENSIEEIIEFHGYQSNVERFRKKCDISLVCSESEAFGRVTVESMYYKQLVIGSNVGGTIEIINDGINGFLYKQGDYLDLANRIIYAIENKEVVNDIVERAHERALDFSIDKTANKVIEEYKNILSNRKEGICD